MSTSVEERLSRLEERLERLESWVQVPADRPAPRPAKPGAAKAAPAPAPPKPRPEPLPRRDLEELLGGRLLALVGGVAVLVGLTFLVALAVERGWLDEKARTVLAFIGSALLLGLGAWLHENRGRTQASLAACGTGLAGLFLSLAEAAAVAVLVWRRWDWLRAGAVALVLVQIADWAFSADPSIARGFPVLALFGALNLAAAVAFELRTKTDTRRATTLIIVGNAAVLGALGAEVAGSRTSTGWWLAGLAVAHAAAGLLLRLQPRNRTIAIWLFGVGLVAANVAFVVLVSGVAIPIGWAAAAAALALPARAVTGRPKLVYAVVGAQVLLAVLHVLAYDATLNAVAQNTSASVWPVLAIAVSTFLVARLTPAKELEWRAAADATALAAVAYGTAVVLDGVALAGAWALEAMVLVELGRRLGHRVAAAGGLGFLLLVAIHALAFEARPSSLVNGADPFWKAALVIGAVSVVAALAYRRGLGLFAEERMLLATTAGTAAVYLVSIGIVSGFQPGPSVREQGQAILSAFWSLLGLGLLWAGLRRDLRPLRLAGVALLAVAVGKVFLYDMAALDRGYRVLSFVVLGLLLLAGAYAYQRLRRAVLRT